MTVRRSGSFALSISTTVLYLATTLASSRANREHTRSVLPIASCADLLERGAFHDEHYAGARKGISSDFASLSLLVFHQSEISLEEQPGNVAGVFFYSP